MKQLKGDFPSNDLPTMPAPYNIMYITVSNEAITIAEEKDTGQVRTTGRRRHKALGETRGVAAAQCSLFVPSLSALFVRFG